MTFQCCQKWAALDENCVFESNAVNGAKETSHRGKRLLFQSVYKQVLVSEERSKIISHFETIFLSPRTDYGAVHVGTPYNLYQNQEKTCSLKF